MEIQRVRLYPSYNHRFILLCLDFCYEKKDKTVMINQYHQYPQKEQSSPKYVMYESLAQSSKSSLILFEREKKNTDLSQDTDHNDDIMLCYYGWDSNS